MRDQKPEVRAKIEETKDLDAETEKALVAAIGEFQLQFSPAKPAAVRA